MFYSIKHQFICDLVPKLQICNPCLWQVISIADLFYDKDLPLTELNIYE